VLVKPYEVKTSRESHKKPLVEHNTTPFFELTKNTRRKHHMIIPSQQLLHSIIT